MPRRDLAAAVGELGHELQSARIQEQQAINEALRPLIIVLVALGVLAFGATAVAAAQVVQRNRDRWLSDDATLRPIGMARGQVRFVELATAGVVAALAVGDGAPDDAARVAGRAGRPAARLDPAQGFAVDGAVAGVGAVAIVARSRSSRSCSRRCGDGPRGRLEPVTVARQRARRPATAAGLTLALRADDRHGRCGVRSPRRPSPPRCSPLCAAFVASAVALTETPARYGFDADLLAVNPYGDQSAPHSSEAFGERDDVVAATGFTSGSFLLDGRAVPGLAATTVKGELTSDDAARPTAAFGRRDRRRPGHARRASAPTRRRRAGAGLDGRPARTASPPATRATCGSSGSRRSRR